MMKKILLTAIAMVALGVSANAQSFPGPFKSLALECSLASQAHAESQGHLNPD